VKPKLVTVTPVPDAIVLLSSPYRHRHHGHPDWSDFPTRAGSWWWKPYFNGIRIRVEVEETYAGGRICKALKMGGSSQCPGHSDWRGYWQEGPTKLLPKSSTKPIHL